jgi:hypothetical protein
MTQVTIQAHSNGLASITKFILFKGALSRWSLEFSIVGLLNLLHKKLSSLENEDT